MRKLWLGIIGLAAASTANAAVVTYTMSYDDFGAGTPVAGSWAVYASVSPDSAGLFAFGVDLAPGAGGTIATLANRANGAVMTDSSTDEQLNVGFTTGRTQDLAAGKFSGLGDLGAGAAMKPIYGFGQHVDKLDNYIPANFDVQSATFGGGRAVNYGTETYTPPGGTARNMFLVGRGTYTGPNGPVFETGSVDSKASVYVSNATGTQNVIAQLVYDTRDLIPSATTRFTLDAAAAAGTTNQAVGGSIAVTGSNNGYISEVDQLLANSATGNAPIATIGTEPGNIYVMAKLTGTQAQIDAFLNDAAVTADVGAADSQFAPLHAFYDPQFGGTGFNALFKFTSAANIRTINWDTAATGVTVDQLAAVPEPATMGLLGLGALGLLARRRRNA
jgi:hypothetical protein